MSLSVVHINRQVVDEEVRQLADELRAKWEARDKKRAIARFQKLGYDISEEDIEEIAQNSTAI